MSLKMLSSRSESVSGHFGDFDAFSFAESLGFTFLKCSCLLSPFSKSFGSVLTSTVNFGAFFEVRLYFFHHKFLHHQLFVLYHVAYKRMMWIIL